jgi:high-affinity iron transporter
VAAVVSPTSWYGALLAGVFNFDPEPTVLQVAVWIAYVVITLIVFLRVSRARTRPALVTTPEGAS